MATGVDCGLVTAARASASIFALPGVTTSSSHALVIPSLMYRIYHGENPLIVWGDGSCERDFVYSRDVAEGCILALWHGTNNPAGFVNLGSGRVYTVKELVETLRGFLDFEYRFDASKPTGVQRRFLDITLARQTLGYDPTTTLEQGLRQTWQWFVEHPDEHMKKVCYFEQKESGMQKPESGSDREAVIPGLVEGPVTQKQSRAVHAR